ncbi:hypothetical protein ACHAXT_008720 [Thalassiosira profunda]
MSSDFGFSDAESASSKDSQSVSVASEDDVSMASDDDASDYTDEDENLPPNSPNRKNTSNGGGSSAGRSKSAAKKSSNASAGEEGKEKTIEETYQKKTQLEHILIRPDTYIGSAEPLTQPMFVLDNGVPGNPRIRQREITYTGGFYKIFDEIVVNAADNKQRDPDMDRMEVEVDAKRGVISVMNNGKGIPVAMHKEHEVYVPTLIFGHLLTGSNFDDEEEKTTGGRNGYGAKLANIFSKKFVVECLDSERGLKFRQVWRNNMHEPEEPIVEDCSKSERKGGDYVKISFKPDFERLSMDGLDEDAAALISKRAYDIAGSMANKEGKKLKVFLNGEKLKVANFKAYLGLFDGISPPVVYEKLNDEWEVGVGSVIDGSGFQQISFVNAIATTKGGGHVDYVTDLIVKHLQAVVKKKRKGGKALTIPQVKSHLSIFINCLVSNPTFDSQTKENMTVPSKTFKKSVSLSEQFLKKVEKCGVVESIMQFAQFQEGRALKNKGGTKKNVLKGIAKLDDANFAGSRKSSDCTLIITEGDSAKSLAVSGLSVVGRDYYGVFPLKGKPLNVRDATHAQIMKNEELKNLVHIMGLKYQKKYTEDNIKELRYGHLMIMADQDHDGSHIKGLVINFIHHFWPSLLDVPGFLQQFITPIVKCTKGKKSKTFFTLPEYEEWKESTGNDGKGWHIKYYKGLGTSTSSEAKEYFSNLDIHEIHFNELSTDVVTRDLDDMEDGDGAITSGAGLIDMAFSKKCAGDRKAWIKSISPDTYLDYSEAQANGVNISDFVNKELALFSQADVRRSLPHLLDGLKISQRKVLYACFKKKLKGEIKVAQLAGYVGEHSAYHHGEASLHGTIVGMAQNYVGSNNINLLFPSGQFGTRRMAGKDAASARYIFTRLEKITRAIFHPDDDDLLKYLTDDGLSVEPEYYMPVIPMLLVNGSEGIGTGWSSNVRSHNPREIISNLRRLIDNEETEEMHPYFAGWSGEIIAETGKREGCYIVRGKIERTNSTTLLITELPVGTSTEAYKHKVLEGMLAGADKSDGKKKKRKSADEEDEEEVISTDITEFKENHTDTTVSFTVIAPKATLDLFEEEKGGLASKFKLSSTISTKNMTAFDKDGKIRTYGTSLDVLKAFFSQRRVFYIARKEMLLVNMRKNLSMLENKARFVQEVCEDELIVTDRKRSELLADLKERGYDLFTKDEGRFDGEEEEEGDAVEENASDAELAKGYEYLLGMKIWSLTFERAEELRKERDAKAEEAKALEATSPDAIWSADLDAIEELLEERDDLQPNRPLTTAVPKEKASDVAKKEAGVAKKEKKKPASEKPAKKPTKRTKKKVDELERDSDASETEESSESEESDTEEFDDDISLTEPKQKSVVAKPTKKPDADASGSKKKNICAWDSEIEYSDESEDDFMAEDSAKKGPVKKAPVKKESDAEESDGDFVMEEPAPKAKPAPKKGAPAKKKSAARRKSAVKDESGFGSDDSLSAGEKKPTTKGKAGQKTASKKAESAPKRKSGSSKGAKKPAKSSGGKAKISLGVSPLQNSQRKLSSSKKHGINLSKGGEIKEARKSTNEEKDEMLVDSDSSPETKPKKIWRKSKGSTGSKSEPAKSRKRELEDSDSDPAPPRKRRGSGNTKPTYNFDSSDEE